MAKEIVVFLTTTPYSYENTHTHFSSSPMPL